MAKRLYNKYLREYYESAGEVNEFDWCVPSDSDDIELWILKKYCKDNDCEPHEKVELESLIRDLERRQEYNMIDLLAIGLKKYLEELQKDVLKMEYLKNFVANDK